MDGRDDRVWKTLADPVRRQILDVLREGPQTTGRLCESFRQTRFGVMKHLDALVEAGVVSVERRGRERWNHLDGAALERAVARWLTPFQSQWSDRLARLTRLLSEEPKMSQVSATLMEIRQQVELPAAPERVFSALTRNIGHWWSSPFRQCGADGLLELSPEIGASMIETGANGHVVVWARVEEIAPPSRLYLSGRFAVVGALAGRVHFDLEPVGAGCRLTVGHQAIGAISPEAQNAFDAGWRELLDRRLRAHLAGATHA